MIASETKIKICGIRNIGDAVMAANLGADAIGFVFYSRSPRYISPRLAKKIIPKIDDRIKKVGVFVNPELNYVKEIACLCKLDMLQFHGNEEPSFCSKFLKYEIIKAFRIKNKDSFKDISRYKKVSYYLFDSFKEGYFGGTGSRFPLSLFKEVKIDKPFFLSGGLNPKNVRDAIRIIQPDWVDVSSGVEAKAGKKDPRLLKEFIRKARSV